MIRKVIVIALLLFIASLSMVAQPAERRISRKEYIDIYKEEAVKEMLRSGVPASITMAQALLESADGNSPLAMYANNHFGIKCHKGWEGPTFYQDDDKKNECFRKYYTVYDSYKDHSDFLKTRERYSFLFDYSRTDYVAWANGLKRAGYATNPKYPELLIKIIEDYNLYELDLVDKMPLLAANTDSGKSEKLIEQKNVNLAQAGIQIHPNNIRFVVAKEGDTYFKIAKENDMGLWQIYKYNDLNKGQHPRKGEIIFLQPKRNTAKADYHIVKKGETMHSISQQYGVKINKLYRKNNMIPGTIPAEGQKLSLKKRI